MFVPAGRGRTSFVDTRDVAQIAASVLTEPGHETRAYELTGSEALSYDALAGTLSGVLGRAPRTFRAFAADHANAWAPSPALSP